MANQKPKRKLTAAEIDERAQIRSQQRTRRWQSIAFVFISVVVLLSMVITLFVR